MLQGGILLLFRSSPACKARIATLWKNVYDISYMDAVVTQFMDLVRIDSPSNEEAGIADYLENWLNNHGFSVNRDHLNNLLGKREGAGESLLFTAHMDTVEPGRGIKPEIQDDRIVSDGSTILGCDNKAPLAAMLTGVEEYLSINGNPRPIELLFTVKEETGDGLNGFDFSAIQSKKGIAIDLGKDVGGIAISSPFVTNFHVTFTGKAAHIRVMEQGNSAVTPLGEFLSEIRTGRADEGETSINIGLVSAGTGTNTVAAQAKIGGDLRSHDKVFFERKLSEIENAAKRAGEKNGITVHFYTDGYCPGYAFDEENELVQSVKRINEQLGLKPILWKAFSVSDVNMLHNAGLNVINLGDGVIGHHTTEESISIENLVILKNQVIAFLQEL